MKASGAGVRCGGCGKLLRFRTVGRLAQLVEHRLHTAGVSGSSPLAPTNLSLNQFSRLPRPAPKQFGAVVVSAPGFSVPLQLRQVCDRHNCVNPGLASAVSTGGGLHACISPPYSAVHHLLGSRRLCYGRRGSRRCHVRRPLTTPPRAVRRLGRRTGSASRLAATAYSSTSNVIRTSTASPGPIPPRTFFGSASSVRPSAPRHTLVRHSYPFTTA